LVKLTTSIIFVRTEVKQCMEPKQNVLILENRREWHTILERLRANADAAIEAVQTYTEALALLEERSFHLAVIDLTLSSADHDYDLDGTHDGLQVLAEIAQRFPSTRLVVLGENLSRETLRNTPGIPDALTLVARQHWSLESFEATLTTVLKDGDPASAAELRLVDEDEPALPTEPVSITSQLGQLPRGLTAPLRGGLYPPGVGSRPGRPRILIVEDASSWQDDLARMMEDDHYFWRVAPSHEQAMERLKLETFHVVLLDLTLGDHGVPIREGKGWQLLDYIVANAPKTKLIILSDSATSSDVARLFMGYPIKGFIDKRAFAETELRTIVRDQSAGPSLRFVTMGDFRVLRDGKLINDFGHDLAEKAIKILLSRRGESVSVNELIEYIWPGADPKEKYTLLGTIINAARGALEPDLPRPSDSKFIIRSGSNYQFNMINVEVDAEQLRQFVSEGRQQERRGETEQALRNYKAARELYKGDYLPTERLARWTMQERSALQTLYTEALNRMADIFAELGDLKLAVDAATQAQQVDSYVESTYRRLMRYYSCMGNREKALSVYRRLVILFSEFFNEDPAPETTQLSRDIEAGISVACVEDKASTGEFGSQPA
jgi:two-component SAPR family response regulator